jgi:hypothetical protein
MARRSRKTDPQQPSTDELPSRGVEPHQEETNHGRHLDLDPDYNSTAAATGRLTFPRA